MAIKDFVYTTKQQLESVTLQSFRHSHIYELLAAGFGFNTRASLDATHIIAVMARPQVPEASALATLHCRLTELGYDAVSDSAGAALLSTIADQCLGVTSIESVIETLLRGDWGFPDDWYADDWYDIDDDEENSDFEQVINYPSLDPKKLALLIEGLNSAATRGSAAAHYALALIYRGDDLTEEAGSSYWYSLMEQGRELEGVQLEWATTYKTHLLNAEREALHLNEAARRGWADAKLDIAIRNAQRAESQGDLEQAEYWYKEAAGLGHVEAMRSLAWLAEKSRAPDAAMHWTQQAALHGDIDAVRDLIDESSLKKTFHNWVWVYFAELLGTDLRKSTLRAYHDGGLYAGQEYDDDQGGPLYVDGDEGIQLPSLNALDEMRARETAKELFSRLNRS